MPLNSLELSLNPVHDISPISEKLRMVLDSAPNALEDPKCKLAALSIHEPGPNSNICIFVLSRNSFQNLFDLPVGHNYISDGIEGQCLGARCTFNCFIHFFFMGLHFG